MLYPINDIFYSIQGEGRNTGMPAWFIRMAGCNLKCSWCDTNHKEKFVADEDLIISILNINSCRNVVITGGEPTIRDLTPLLKKLKAKHCYVALETNGTNNLLYYRAPGLIDWVTVSPKKLPIKVGCMVNEVKIIWPTKICLEDVVKEIKVKYYYLQPLDDKTKNKHNRKLTIQKVKDNPIWRLSLQTQKIIGEK